MSRQRLRGATFTWLGLTLTLLTAVGMALAQTPFINEIHYDNSGTDTGEAVEIAGPAGTDLSGWSLVRYNGASSPTPGMVYTSPAAPETFPPGTTIPGGCGAFGVVVINYPQDGLQNGPTDAIALVDNTGAVVQFLSYEGPVTAANGPAAGLTSTDIGVSEIGTTTVGFSLQLQGTGAVYTDFAWAAAMQNTFGACNTGQAFTGPDALPSVAQTVPAHGSTGVAPGTPITVTFSESVTAEPAAFSIACGLANLAFTLSGGPQTYTLTPTSPLPSSTSCTVTVFAAAVADGAGQPPASDTAFDFSTAALFACGQPATAIHLIQGSGPASPSVGDNLAVEGIVVGAFQGSTRLSGFYLQEDAATWDGDPATSEGIFIFDGNLGVPVPV